MTLRTSFALACVLAITACKKDPAPAAPAAEPAAKPAAAQPAAAAPTADGQPSKGLTSIPTAAELIALIDKATRIEAKSGKMEKREWSKDLTKEDIASLKAGIGDAELSAGAPRCIPTVDVIIYQEQQELAKLGGFCSTKGPMRFDYKGIIGSLIPRDHAKINAALESPVDK